MSAEVDAAIFACAGTDWMKVARLLVEASAKLEAPEDHPRFDEIAGRVQAVAGELELQGNLTRWRFSEVRLPRSPKPPGLTLAARLHITGASGCGVSTSGAALARRWCAKHLDTDAFYWLATDPPFQTSRTIPRAAGDAGGGVRRRGGWVLSGSLDGWGDPLIPRFEQVIFLTAPTELRLARLAERERRRNGAAIEAGGPLHAHHLDFMAYAAALRHRRLHRRPARPPPRPPRSLARRPPLPGGLLGRLTADQRRWRTRYRECEISSPAGGTTKWWRGYAAATTLAICTVQFRQIGTLQRTPSVPLRGHLPLRGRSLSPLASRGGNAVN